ncbi:MAG: GNAT family N-acetyltransferase [Actinobacteria bacterium]|nr:GNAT family N-acetyltransferase [Actinomycetota bacterium]
MTDPCRAREATADDLPVLAELIRECVAELRVQRGGAMWAVTDARVEPVEERLSEEIGRSDVLVVTGEYDHVAVGVAVCALCTATDGRRYARVTDLFTLVGARHVGVGETMMDACVAWARERDAFAIDAGVLPGTRDAKNFFEGFGLTARALTVSRLL